MRTELRAIMASAFLSCAQGACGGPTDVADATEQQPVLGHAALALETTVPSGSVYRLNGHFTFYNLTDPAAAPIGVQSDFHFAVQDVGLPPAVYSVMLDDGWILAVDEPGMDPRGRPEFQRVNDQNRVLTSPNPVEIEVLENRVTHLDFAFRVGTESVPFGEGKVKVSVSVDEQEDVGDVGCAPGEVRCNTNCIDLKSDPSSCGSCFNVCAAGQVCESGSCDFPGDLPTQPVQ
jgi:hypothetical protein